MASSAKPTPIQPRMSPASAKPAPCSPVAADLVAGDVAEHDRRDRGQRPQHHLRARRRRGWRWPGRCSPPVPPAPEAWRVPAPGRSMTTESSSANVARGHGPLHPGVVLVLGQPSLGVRPGDHLHRAIAVRRGRAHLRPRHACCPYPGPTVIAASRRMSAPQDRSARAATSSGAVAIRGAGRNGSPAGQETGSPVAGKQVRLPSVAGYRARCGNRHGWSQSTPGAGGMRSGLIGSSAPRSTSGRSRGRSRSGRLGLAGDEQVDKPDHGGYEQALYAYAREDLDWWVERLGRELASGTFGENITTSGLEVTGAPDRGGVAARLGRGPGHLAPDSVRRVRRVDGRASVGEAVRRRRADRRLPARA